MIESENEIITGFLDGSRKYERQFLEVYGGVIKYAVQSVTIKFQSIEYADLFHDTIIYILENNKQVIRLFKNTCPFKNYLFIICRRFVLSKLKNEGRHFQNRSDSYNEEISRVILKEDSQSTESKKREFEKVYNSLNSKDKIFFKMRCIDNRPAQEVMAFFGWNSETTVHARKSKILSKLKKQLEKNRFVDMHSQSNH